MGKDRDMKRLPRIIVNFSLLLPMLVLIAFTTILVWSFEAVYDDDMRGIWTGRRWLWEN